MEASNEKNAKIKKGLEDVFIFIKCDCATRIRSIYLGVNARWVSKETGEPVTRTLAVLDTLSRHTAKELKEILMKILEEYEIPLDHVLCCVTDNVTNMVKLVKDMNKERFIYQQKTLNKRLRLFSLNEY